MVGALLILVPSLKSAEDLKVNPRLDSRATVRMGL
jgi:hypothetical protein